jgi:hypothetical protein
MGFEMLYISIFNLARIRGLMVNSYEYVNEPSDSKLSRKSLVLEPSCAKFILNMVLPKFLYSFIFSSICSACPGHLVQVRKDKMGGACRVHGRE